MNAPLPYTESVEMLPQPGPLRGAVAVLRIGMTVIMLLVMLPILLTSALIPIRVGGERLVDWMPVLISRSFLAITGLNIDVQNRDVLRAHRGFVFFNHVSYMDIPLLLTVRPLRFLAARGVRSLPIIGWMARAVGTVFVDRGADSSRAEARADLARAASGGSAPVALAPEGGVQDGPWVEPFRHGAFEVASESEATVLLVALDFTPRGYVAWRDGESLISAYWRLASRPESVTAHIVAIPPPREITGAPEVEAVQAERVVNAALASLWRIDPPEAQAD